ncbi:nucleotidyltransferase domain-containing protein [Paenibacillus sp. MMS20-IR301]|uniref:nucleotidyltransferase domain-containing protein n=1 Tax=Paenibacillus sp. MMS20-IR301 TaxID=2895946 RepID=UPI0028E961AE|nr:nucleotidyltransferase domain-containing protein [Paenibacillus sp. MMS20-IR301]WNS42506.1 nucleotidyltransferase domain-containing protein [Paenibacillus sp. MMS20-IR301]
MYQHHQKAIEAITGKLRAREDVLGVIIGGSIAHGYASETSDLDCMLVLSEEDYRKALQTGDIGFFETESTPYEGGYVDGKCITQDYLRKVAEHGTEPARYAFKDAFVAYSRIEGLEELVHAASRYPAEHKEENIQKFYAQLETWKWYFYEGLKRNDRLLMDYSRTNYVMFAGRLILAHNERLFPSYKWLLKELEKAEAKPDNFMQLMDEVIRLQTPESIECLYGSITQFHDWYTSAEHWTVRFMLDSQLNWLEGIVPVLDL